MKNPQLRNVRGVDIQFRDQMFNRRDEFFRGADDQRVGALIGHCHDARGRSPRFTGSSSGLVSATHHPAAVTANKWPALTEPRKKSGGRIIDILLGDWNKSLTA